MQIYRNHNVLDDRDDLEHLYTFESFPVFMGCTASTNSHDLFCDLNIYISKSTGVLQINPILPLEVIYQAAHNSGSIGRIWQQHHAAFAEFIRYQKPTSVLEIGGGHGKLSSIYREDIEWTIMEPNPKLVEGSSARVIKEFFTKDTNLEQYEFDTIVHSHLFEHVHHPDQFVKLMSESLEIGGKVIFSVPNMRKMLEKKFTNCLNFEHTYFLSEEYITYLMSKHGFKILAQEYFMEDNSIFYAWEKTSSSFEIPLPANLYTIYKNLFLEYVEYHINLVNTLNNDISHYDSYYLFGAHVFSQYLIKFGLDTNKLKCIIDNDKLKQTKRLYGTDILVDSPNIIENDSNPVIIVRAGSFTDEIKLDILQNINQQAVFL